MTAINPAGDGETALSAFAGRITADPQPSQQLAQAKVDPANPQAVVDWLRAQKPDPGVLNRLVAAPEPAVH